MSGVDLMARYGSHHFPGPDCRVTSLRNLLDYFGTKESYSWVAGLSSSVGFTYRVGATAKDRLLDPDLDYLAYFRPISGYRVDCLDRAAQNYSAMLQGNHPDDPDESFDLMRRYLREGIPVLAAVSRRLLAKQPYQFPRCLKGIDFGGHWTMVVGIDDERKVVTLFDTDARTPMELSHDEFQRARSHGDGHDRMFMKSRNRWMVFVPASEQPPKPHLVTVALTRVLAQMRTRGTDGVVYHGLHGIEHLAQELPTWRATDTWPADSLKATAFMLRVNNVLSAGGCGRKSFAAFLRRASAVCQSDALERAGVAAKDAASHWDALIVAVHAVAFSGDGSGTFDTPAMRDRLGRIVDAEHTVADEMQSFLERA